MILAYIDPGAGSMVIQMLIAALVAVPFFLRTQISRGIERIRGRNRPRTDRTAADAKERASRDD